MKIFMISFGDKTAGTADTIAFHCLIIGDFNLSLWNENVIFPHPGSVAVSSNSISDCGPPWGMNPWEAHFGKTRRQYSETSRS